MRHSPEDTGLPYWIYVKYQHLKSPPPLPLGTTVVVGQGVGFSGKTGTTGGRYGTHGYPPLPLSILKSTNGDIQIGSGSMSARGLYLIDPLTFYHEASLTSKASIDPNVTENVVTLPYMTTDAHFWPQDTRCPRGVAGCLSRQIGLFKP